MEIFEYELADEQTGLIRVVKTIDHKSKWGLKNMQGQEILPVVYDYIDTTLHDNLFKVFIGAFEWDEYDEETINLFEELIDDPKSWNGDYYKAALGKGFWGIVNEKNEEVIPISYNSVHFYSASIFITNENGSRIIKWRNGDEKATNWSVVGGQWRAINKEGKTLFAMNCSEQNAHFFNGLSNLEPWDVKYNKQTVGAYFKKDK